MAKTRSQKEALLEQYKQLISDNGGFIAVDSIGLDNVSATELKKKLKTIGSNMHIVKNTVFKIALTETDKALEAQDFEGQTAIITYDADPTEIAKLLKDSQKKTQMLGARYGIIDGNFVSGEKVMELADIPSREVLLAKLLGSLNSPLTGFMNAVTGNARGFVQVLNQLGEKGGATPVASEDAKAETSTEEAAA